MPQQPAEHVRVALRRLEEHYELHALRATVVDLRQRLAGAEARAEALRRRIDDLHERAAVDMDRELPLGGAWRGQAVLAEAARLVRERGLA